jgi:hypothetical protein
MARQRDLNRERTWRQHIERQRASGLTIRDFCVRYELAEAAFYQWRRRIADDDGAAGASASTPTFVPITVVDAPAPSAIDIYLAGGQRVRVRTGCDRALLAAIVELLEGRPC